MDQTCAKCGKNFSGLVYRVYINVNQYCSYREKDGLWKFDDCEDGEADDSYWACPECNEQVSADQREYLSSHSE